MASPPANEVSGSATPPRVSIGLPVYNGARFLAETLDCHLAQTYRDFELIISDNGSTDETEAICRAYADRDARIRYYRSPENRGASWNYNRVFHLSRGEYFKWSSHDDLLAPTYVERCVDVLDQAPSIVVCYPKTTIIDENGSIVREYDDRLNLSEPTPHERARHLVRTIIMANPAFSMMRSSALRHTRLLDSFVSSDYVLLFELALLGEFREIPEPLFFRREHPAMSRHANIGPEQVMKWFDPSHRGRYVTEFWRLFAEHLVSIARLPLSPAEKLKVYATFVPAWGRRRWRRMWYETAGLVRVLPARGKA